jgi:hypothetical protein
MAAQIAIEATGINVKAARRVSLPPKIECVEWHERVDSA